jgi:glucokinase
MAHAIGIDLGGTSIKIGLVNKKGDIVDSIETPTLAESNSIDTIFKNLTLAVRDLTGRNTDKKVQAIGIGSPGAIDPNEGRIVAGIANIPILTGYPLAVEIEKELDIPSFIDNDANNAGRGEFLFGSAKGMKNFVMITIGTGIGGAIFINGELYGGVNNYAGEVGHMLIVDNGKYCTCGNFGCWEAYGSATAMIRKAKVMVERGVDTRLKKSYPDKIDARIIVEEAQKGDEVAMEIVVETGKYVGIGIANLINILNPEAVLIGGGVSQAGDILLNEIKYYAKVNALPRAWEAARIVLAKLGNKAGILGSAALAFMRSE